MRSSFDRCAYQLGLSLLLIVGLCSLICQASDDAAAKTELPTARAKFTLPRLFDFDRYKAAFNKQYTSLTENAARARLFLGRAFRAFVSAINYKQRKSSYYLAINQMSDWTPDEVRKIDLGPEKMRKISDELNAEDTMGPNNGKQASETEPLLPVASLDEVESALGELAAHEESARRMLDGRVNERRRRRDLAAAKERRISLDDVAREPKAAAEASDKGLHIESNNPEYEPPELVSSGWPGGDCLPLEPLSKQAIDMLTNSPGAQFLSWVMKGFAGNKNGNSDAKQQQDDVDQTGGSVVQPDEIFFDHRDECMFAPRNQGKCGSCYAFAAITIYEWLYCKATGKKVAFSEQYLIDCGYEYELDGCAGGYAHRVPEFVRKYGLELRANYPYRTQEDACPYDSSTPAYARGYLRVSTRKVKRIDMPKWDRELAKSPMIVSLLVGDAFYEYGGGVYDGADCDQNRGHAVALVGSGREDGQEYWLFRNSFSPIYGDSGYYKLNKEAKHCVSNEEAFLFTGFSGFEKEQGVNAKYHPYPLKRRYEEYFTTELLR